MLIYQVVAAVLCLPFNSPSWALSHFSVISPMSIQATGSITSARNAPIIGGLEHILPVPLHGRLTHHSHAQNLADMGLLDTLNLYNIFCHLLSVLCFDCFFHLVGWLAG